MVEFEQAFTTPYDVEEAVHEAYAENRTLLAEYLQDEYGVRFAPQQDSAEHLYPQDVPQQYASYFPPKTAKSKKRKALTQEQLEEESVQGIYGPANRKENFKAAREEKYVLPPHNERPPIAASEEPYIPRYNYTRPQIYPLERYNNPLLEEGINYGQPIGPENLDVFGRLRNEIGNRMPPAPPGVFEEKRPGLRLLEESPVVGPVNMPEEEEEEKKAEQHPLGFETNPSAVKKRKSDQAGLSEKGSGIGDHGYSMWLVSTERESLPHDKVDFVDHALQSGNATWRPSNPDKIWIHNQIPFPLNQDWYSPLQAWKKGINIGIKGIQAASKLFENDPRGAVDAAKYAYGASSVGGRLSSLDIDKVRNREIQKFANEIWAGHTGATTTYLGNINEHDFQVKLNEISRWLLDAEFEKGVVEDILDILQAKHLMINKPPRDGDGGDGGDGGDEDGDEEKRPRRRRRARRVTRPIREARPARRTPRKRKTPNTISYGQDEGELKSRDERIQEGHDFQEMLDSYGPNMTNRELRDYKRQHADLGFNVSPSPPRKPPREVFKARRRRPIQMEEDQPPAPAAPVVPAMDERRMRSPPPFDFTIPQNLPNMAQQAPPPPEVRVRAPRREPGSQPTEPGIPFLRPQKRQKYGQGIFTLVPFEGLSEYHAKKKRNGTNNDIANRLSQRHVEYPEERWASWR